MGDDFWHVVLIGAYDTPVVVFGLNFGLAVVVALPVELAPSHLDELVEVQATCKHAQQVDQHFEVIKIGVDAVGYSCVLDL